MELIKIYGNILMLIQVMSCLVIKVVNELHTEEITGDIKVFFMLL